LAMNQAKVSIIKCPDYESQFVRAALLKHFELHGGLESLIAKGDKVLIKPNLIAPKPKECGTQTDPAVIYELAKLLVDYGAKPFVGDSPAWADARACANALGLIEPLAKLGVEVRQLDEPVKRRLEFCRTRVGISKYALEADKIINLPKLKTHQQLVATIAVKNMFGCVSGKAKAVWHYKKGATFEEFCTMLIGIYKLLNPAINIIDAVIAMEGPGPIRGNPVHLGWIAASRDPIAAEIICSELIGIDARKLPIIETAKKLRFGCVERINIEVVGQIPSDNERRKLTEAQLVPLRFTPLRIIKSIIRQIFILVKSK
jgi:uncharacterized protein (DUF362 family)